MNTPVVSGNVSLYNETEGISIYPTPTIVMVGVNENTNKVLPNIFQKDGNLILLIGETKGNFGWVPLYLQRGFLIPYWEARFNTGILDFSLAWNWNFGDFGSLTRQWDRGGFKEVLGLKDFHYWEGF